jgi:sirohydrochlorin cobaltochelatase
MLWNGVEHLDFVALPDGGDMSDQAIVLFAHGARDPEWAAPFAAVRARVKVARPDALVLVAFQEFMEPTLEAAVAQSAAQGARRVAVVPLFLGQGSHVKRDLPQLVERERLRHPQLEMRILPAIGEAPEILQAIADWISDAAGPAGAGR